MKTFWCKTHLEELPTSKQSPDARYCQDCYDFLLKEAELLSSKHGKPDWIPDSINYPVNDAVDYKSTPLNPAGVSEYRGLLLSTLDDEKITVDKNTSKTHKRGRKKTVLPEELIILWSKNMGSKAMALKLKKEYGIKTSYKTIQRRMK